LGDKSLKNVKDPIGVYKVYPENYKGTPANLPVDPKEPGKRAPSKSIAVLPFVNMSNDLEQEYFSDGMAEEILNSLVHLKDLKVADRTSSFQFKCKNLDLREIGRS
jgi:adenylate cyclase